MSTTTGKPTRTEIAMKYGFKPAPADDPIYSSGWMIGATQPYRHRPPGSKNEESSSAPQDPMLPAMNGLEDALQAMAKQYGWKDTERQPQEPSASKDSTTPGNSDTS